MEGQQICYRQIRFWKIDFRRIHYLLGGRFAASDTNGLSMVKAGLPAGAP
jgi:hypothetical protein